MSQEVIEFGDGQQKRIAVVETLASLAGASPTIRVKLSDLGEVDKVKAPASAHEYPRVCVYEFDKKYYVLLGQSKLIETLQKNAGVLDTEIDVRLLTKHTLKRSEPAQLNIKVQLDNAPTTRYYGGRGDYDNGGYRRRF